VAQIKVLLVEDDPQFVYLIQRYAAASGCALVHADNACQVMSFVQQNPPDLILIDIFPSKMNGSQILSDLKANPVTRQIPAFVCSASDTVIHEWEDRAEGFLLKPVMYEDFCRILATATIDRNET